MSHVLSQEAAANIALTARDVLRDLTVRIARHDLGRLTAKGPHEKWDHTFRAGQFRQLFRDAWSAYRTAMRILHGDQK